MVDAVHGTEVWRYPTGGQVLSSPMEHNGVIYFG